MFLEDMLDELPDDRPLAILMRHAEREPLLTFEDSIHALLNEAGKKAARRLGKRLACFGRLRLYHSPIRRCGQTAEEIAGGARAGGAEAEIGGKLFELGGPYMKDWKAVMQRVFDSSVGAFVNEWFAGRLPADIVHPPDVAAREQLGVLARQLEDPDFEGVTVNVSHDWNILLVRHHCFEIDDRQIGWPDYLEGVAAYHADGGLCLRFGPYRETVTQRSVAPAPDA